MRPEQCCLLKSVTMKKFYSNGALLDSTFRDFCTLFLTVLFNLKSVQLHIKLGCSDGM